MVKTIGEIILNKDERRLFFIRKVKEPITRLLIKLADKYPEATKENTVHHNTHILIDIRDKFFEYEIPHFSLGLWEALWKMFIAEYEHDPYYRQRFEWVIHEIKKRGDWVERVPTRPSSTLWKEPQSSRYPKEEEE